MTYWSLLFCDEQTSSYISGPSLLTRNSEHLSIIINGDKLVKQLKPAHGVETVFKEFILIPVRVETGMYKNTVGGY